MQSLAVAQGTVAPAVSRIPAARSVAIQLPQQLTTSAPALTRTWQKGSASSARPRRAVCARSAMNPKTSRGGISGQGLRFGVVVALFNDIVTSPLLNGALETFERHGVEEEDVEVAIVPGSFELPVVARKLASSGSFDAILCLGAVVRGSTTHYDAVANSAASGLLNAGLSTGVPVIFGVLTCETMEQAMDRAGGKLGNKGSEAAMTAIEMANLMKML